MVFASTDCEWTKSIRHQATDCDMFLSTHSKAQKFCYKCAAIRHNSCTLRCNNMIKEPPQVRRSSEESLI